MSITSTLCFPGFGILFFPFAPRLQSNALVCGEKSNNPCNNPLTPSFYVNVFFFVSFSEEKETFFFVLWLICLLLSVVVTTIHFWQNDGQMMTQRVREALTFQETAPLGKNLEKRKKNGVAKEYWKKDCWKPRNWLLIVSRVSAPMFSYI